MVKLNLKLLKRKVFIYVIFRVILFVVGEGVLYFGEYGIKLVFIG